MVFVILKRLFISLLSERVSLASIYIAFGFQGVYYLEKNMENLKFSRISFVPGEIKEFLWNFIREFFFIFSR